MINFIIVSVAALFCAIMSFPAFAADPNSGCVEALRAADVVAMRDGASTDLGGQAALIEKACAKSTGDVRQLKAGLVLELRAVAALQQGRTPATVGKALSMLETSSQLFSNCANAKDTEVAASCGFLKAVVEKTAEALIAPAEPSQDA